MYSWSRDAATASAHGGGRIQPIVRLFVTLRSTAFGIVVLLAGAASAAWASSPLKSTMRTWKANAATIDRMMNGASPFDQAEAGRIIQGFATDSRALAARVGGASAQAHDIKARFESFSLTAQAATGDASSRDKIKVQYSKLRADCRSCHDAYAN